MTTLQHPRMAKIATILCTIVTATSSAHAAAVYLTDWTSYTPASYALDDGSASGVLITPSGPVNVQFNGNVSLLVPSYIANDFYDFSNPSAYLYPVSAADAISTDSGPGGNNGAINIHTLSFSRPIDNPVMYINSLGGTSGAALAWTFDQPFTILSTDQSPVSGFGNSLQKLGTGNVLNGDEGNGIIQFSGLVSSITWTSTAFESVADFNVGVVVEIPEPASVALLAIGGVVLFACRRYRSRLG